MCLRTVRYAAMTTPHDTSLVFGRHTAWAQPVPQLPTGWDTRSVQIAEITVDGRTVVTPHGDIDRHAARWFLGDRVPWHSSTPSWATAAAILLAVFTCLLSLLLLLIKETDVWSSKLTVTDGRTTFDTTVYSRNNAQYEGIQAAIAWAQLGP